MNINDKLNWFVPLHLSKKLKSIGFNEPCLIENIETHSEDYNYINFEEEMCTDVCVDLDEVIFVKNEDLKDNIGIYKDLLFKTAIPNYIQVIEWFNKNGLSGWIEYQSCETYTIKIIFKNNLFVKVNNMKYKSYKETIIGLIEELIKIYESKI